eukprot:TRINITY_DN12062_c0_g2_i8.p1 TRINITY_DN12062_c0_g2~~TRINITY_DN12062_c0_g2_i8.p1  ORF type:complete len:432 (+),score=68.91 TRINITY_DN12062_c0_g2_i8:526-1821(+)
MKKYHWSAVKALEFINSRVLDMEIRPSFIQQLTAYETRLNSRGLGPMTFKWSEVSDKTTNAFENEELLLRNTYLNAQMGPFADFSIGKAETRAAKVKWADEAIRQPLATSIGPAAAGGKSAVQTVCMPRERQLADSRNVIGAAKSEPIKADAQETANEDSEAKVISSNVQAIPAEVNNQDKIKIIIQPKYNNFMEGNEITKNTEGDRKIDKPVVTQVISQSNVNNFIINNPAKVEFIGLSPAKNQVAPEIKIHIQKPVNPCPGFSAIRKIIAEKSTPSRPFSAVIRRESPKVKEKGGVSRERRSAAKNIALDQSLKGSLVACVKKGTPDRTRMKQFTNGPIKANFKIPLKGGVEDQIGGALKIARKSRKVKKRMESPSNCLKNIVTTSFKKTPARNMNSRQILKSAITYPAMMRGLSPGNNKAETVSKCVY